MITKIKVPTEEFLYLDILNISHITSYKDGDKSGSYIFMKNSNPIRVPNVTPEQIILVLNTNKMVNNG